jgi:hypothetical protein
MNTFTSRFIFVAILTLPLTSFAQFTVKKINDTKNLYSTAASKTMNPGMAKQIINNVKSSDKVIIQTEEFTTQYGTYAKRTVEREISVKDLPKVLNSNIYGSNTFGNAKVLNVSKSGNKLKVIMDKAPAFLGIGVLILAGESLYAQTKSSSNTKKSDDRFSPAGKIPDYTPGLPSGSHSKVSTSHQ